MTEPGRVPILDGWRGLAIAMVLWDHLWNAWFGPPTKPWQWTGQHGVTIFFVLSGFLITSKLIEGPVDLKRFYIRRFFRLMPVAWTYLLVLIALGLAIHKTVASPSAILGSLLFYRNYVLVDGGASTFHFWSLSLEEQFYLIWPCLLLLAGVRRCRWIAAVGAVACAAYRWANWSHFDSDFYNCQSQARADALLVGCLMALLLQSPEIRAKAARWARYWAIPALAGLLFCIDHFYKLPPLCEVICIAASIAASILHSDSIFVRPLTTRALTGLGLISYSVYVWQEFFMLLMPKGLKNIAICLTAMVLVCLGSYIYIERPFNRLGHRLTRREAMPAGDADIASSLLEGAPR